VKNTPTPTSNDQSTAIAAPDVSPQPPALDEHTGKGGLYSIVDGRRVLQERTEDPAKTPPTAPKAA